MDSTSQAPRPDDAIALTLDRIEDGVATFIDEAGEGFEILAPDLPIRVHEGGCYRVTLDVAGSPRWETLVADAEAEQRLRDETAERLRRLAASDPGGDLAL